jgi:uncharacterized phage protein (TIGR01671 family)
MREIKFRCWDKLNKEMSIVDCFDDEKIGVMLKRGYATIPRKNCVLMQYTGENDRNGKEIYEGDIIKIPENWNEYGMNAGEIYEIFYNECGFRLKPKYRKNAKGMWLEDTEKLEVIGNIYENPELINLK